MSDVDKSGIMIEEEKITRLRIFEQTYVYFPRLLRPYAELKILFEIQEELRHWNVEHGDKLHFVACTEICKQKMPEDYSLARRFIHQTQRVKYPLDTSVVSINPDYAKAEEITLRDPRYRPLAEKLKQMLGVGKDIREAYEK